MRRSTIALTAILALAACSSNDDSDDAVNADTAEFVLPAGAFTIEAIATTEFDSNGGTCGDATGEITITENALRGNVLSSNGFTLGVDGTLSDTGDVTGGFAQGSNTIASFSGQFTETSGSGIWTDNFDCTGTWTAAPVTAG